MFNLMGALRTSMATCGYHDIAEFNRAELMVAPALQTEGKHLQRDQQVGMGAATRRAAAALVADAAERRRLVAPGSVLAGRVPSTPHGAAAEPRHDDSRRATCRSRRRRSWSSTTAASTRS